MDAEVVEINMSADTSAAVEATSSPIAPDPSSSSPSDNAALSELVARLSAPDSIMEPDVLSTLASYMQSGGEPRTAIRLLSDNYRGYPDTINLLDHWLSLTDDPPSSSPPPPPQHSYATEAFQQLVVDAFEPAKADSVLATFDAMPDWLTELLVLDGWRAVMERLHTMYPHSLFVAFAVRAVKADHDGEGTSAAETTMADVRQRVEQSLVQLIEALQSNSPAFHSHISALASLAMQNECAYLYTQYLLQLLSREAGIASLLAKRVSEDVSVFAATSSSVPSVASSHTLLDFILLHSPRHTDVSSALLPWYRSLARCAAAELTLPLLSSSLPRLTAGDVHKLYTVYSSSSPQPPPPRPPVALLYSAPLLCSMVHMLFEAERTTQERQQLIFLLCYASSPPTTATAAVADTQQLTSLLSSLTSLVTVLGSKSWLLSASTVLTQLRSAAAVSSPLLATVALYFIHTQLTSSAYFDSPSAASFTPLLLSVVGELITGHPLLHSALFTTLTVSFSLPSLSTILDSLSLIHYRKHLLLLLLHLLLTTSTHITPILSWSHSQLVSHDHSLVRTFVLGLLGGIGDCSISGSGGGVGWLGELVRLLCRVEVRTAMRQWVGELSEAVRSERWRRLMADKRLGKTDTGRKRLRRMGGGDTTSGGADADWQPEEDEVEVKRKQQRKASERVDVAAVVVVEVKKRSFLASDAVLDADEDEVLEEVRHFGRMVVGVHSRLSAEHEKGQLDEQGEQVLSEIDKLFVSLQET